MTNNEVAFPTQKLAQGWLGLNIGNSRLHWAWIIGSRVQYAWEASHLSGKNTDGNSTQLSSLLVAFGPDLPHPLRDYLQQLSSQPALTWPDLWIVSVVPEQTTYFHDYPQAKILTLAEIPLKATYLTLGVDRALAVWAAGETYGWPILVIDAGTALTVSGADKNCCFVGGAILPGLGLQLRSLAQFTANLPEMKLPSQLPSRWARETSEAIQSGVVYTVLAGVQGFIQQWQQEYPSSAVVITGGDGQTLLSYLQATPTIAGPTQLVAAPQLIFEGLARLRV
jgi:type III pantothenate kinase